jgi:hypothetical protein
MEQEDRRMRLDDTEQAKYEALAEAANLAIEPIAKLAETAPVWHSNDFDHALDQSVLAVMDLVDKAYKQGFNDGKENKCLSS